MKYNYPVKYAVMPIMSDRTYANGYERQLLCYIVSKCYVLKEVTEYDSEGFSKKQYVVQCPYRKEEFDCWRRVNPDIDDSFYTDKVYDCLKDAIHEKINKNKELVDNQLFYTKEQKEEYNKRFLESLTEYSELERLMIENTQDLIVGKKPKSQNFISLYISKKSNNSRVGRFEIKSYTIYDLFRGYDSINNFMAYSISEEEYNEYKKLPFNNYQKFMHTPLLSHKGGSSIVTVLNGNESIYLSIIDGEIKPVIPDVDLTFDEPNLIIFTTENYEDIVNTYGLNNKYKKVLNLSKYNG